MQNDVGQALWGAVRVCLDRVARVLSRDHAGQSMVEYGIIVALIAIVAFATVQYLGEGIQQVFQRILDSFNGLRQGPSV
jgi:Flp pilus assembly pilin Flp